MLKKLLVPLAIASALAGITTSYGAAGVLLHPDTSSVVQAQAAPAPAHTTSVQLAKDATATSTPSPSPSATTPTVAPADRYSYKGTEKLTKVALMMRTTGKFKTYNSSSDKLYHAGKCVVSVYAQSINGYHDASDQAKSSTEMVQQYTKALKVSKVDVKDGYLYSNEEYGEDSDNYKVATAYSTFSAKAVHGIVHARMFSNGFGVLVSVSCPTSTKLPDVHKNLRLKTDIGVVTQQQQPLYAKDYRYGPGPVLN